MDQLKRVWIDSKLRVWIDSIKGCGLTSLTVHTVYIRMIRGLSMMIGDCTGNMWGWDEGSQAILLDGFGWKEGS